MTKIKKTPTSFLISTDLKGYETAKDKHLKYNNSFDELIAALDQFKKVKQSDLSDVKVNPLFFVQSHILDAYKSKNLMDLSYSKLVHILEIDTTLVDSASIKFANQNPFNAAIPLLKDFEVYAETPRQIKRMKALNKLIDGINDLHETEGDYNIQSLKSSLMQALNGRLISSQENIFEPIPNPYYVMNGRVYG